MSPGERCNEIMRLIDDVLRDQAQPGSAGEPGARPIAANLRHRRGARRPRGA